MMGLYVLVVMVFLWSLTKQPNSKGSSSAHGGGMPTTTMDETMAEEEFFEWLQNAMQSGLFETGSMSKESSSPRNGSSSKNRVKRKRKGKKQW